MDRLGGDDVPAGLALLVLVAGPHPAAQQDRAAIDRKLAATLRCLEMLDQRLRQLPYLDGPEMSYADIVAGVAMYRLTRMEIARPSLPNLDAWHARLNERAAFRKAVCVSYDELVGRLAF